VDFSPPSQLNFYGPTEVPVPDRVITAGMALISLLIVTVPSAGPALDGENMTVIEHVPPTGKGEEAMQELLWEKSPSVVTSVMFI
jgi:hypothetical protein